MCVCITVPAPTVLVTSTTVIRGSDAVLTCTVTAVDDNPEDLSINIVWSPNPCHFNKFYSRKDQDEPDDINN